MHYFCINKLLFRFQLHLVVLRVHHLIKAHNISTINVGMWIQLMPVERFSRSTAISQLSAMFDFYNSNNRLAENNS